MINGSGSWALRVRNSKKIKVEGFTLLSGNIGLEITNAYSNRIEHNIIDNNSVSGIFCNNIMKCLIKSNVIDNNNIGIYYSGTALSNAIIQNTMYGNGSYGIFYSGTAGGNYTARNVIDHNGNSGIYYSGNVTNDNIVRNMIYTNASYGIYCVGGGIKNNAITSNEIGNEWSGIYLNFVGNNDSILRNLIRNEMAYGICFSGSGSGGSIINNTLFKDGSYGIMAQANGLEIYNNVILSNSIGVYGNGSSGTLVGNVMYGNTGGDWSGSGLAIGSGNVTDTDPLIDMVSSYTIVSPLSPCCDNGTNIPGISDVFKGTGPDSGWKESAFSKNKGPFYVDNGSGNDNNLGTWAQPFRTIQKAANAMMPGPPACTSSTTYIFPGTYSNSIAIKSNKNPGYMVFTKCSNVMPVLTGGSGSSSGFTVQSANRIMISWLNITAYTEGIHALNSSYDLILSNQINNNVNTGISLLNSPHNRISGNLIQDNVNSYGISLNNSSSNVITNNQINHDATGIGLANSSYNKMTGNKIMLNTYLGLQILGGGSSSNYITANVFNGANAYLGGINLQDTHNNRVDGNFIAHDGVFGWGIWTWGTAGDNLFINNSICSNQDAVVGGGAININETGGNDIIMQNRIFANRNSGYAINLNGGNSVKIIRNTFYNNDLGIGISTYNPVNNVDIINNVFYENNSYAVSFADSTFSGRIYNNVFLSNSASGIITGNSPVAIGYNTFYGNGTDISGTFSNHNGNSYGVNPVIATSNALFIIANAGSECIDSGTNIPYVTTNYLGSGPDRGWQESSFISVNYGPFYVDDNSGNDNNPGTFAQPFLTIQRAAKAMMPGMPALHFGNGFHLPRNL